MHHDRATILERFAREQRFTITLDHGDTAWDPETGDTLLGGVIVHYRWGTFPGTAYRAIIVGTSDREVRDCPVCDVPVIVSRDGERAVVYTVHHHINLDESRELCPGSLADVTTPAEIARWRS